MINSLITAAGECRPRKGTISTWSQFSIAEPTTAPTTSPPAVVKAAFPTKFNDQITLNFAINT